MVLPERFELSTSPLPRECSTPELRQHLACLWDRRGVELFCLKSLSCKTQVLVPISGADRNEGAFAIRPSGTQAVFWDFFRSHLLPPVKAGTIEGLARQSWCFRPVSPVDIKQSCGSRRRADWPFRERGDRPSPKGVWKQRPGKSEVWEQGRLKAGLSTVCRLLGAMLLISGWGAAWPRTRFWAAMGRPNAAEAGRVSGKQCGRHKMPRQAAGSLLDK